MRPPAPLGRHARRAVALVLVLALYAFTRLPAPSEGDRAALAKRFAFSRLPLPALAAPSKGVRAVNPSLARIAAWISSVGAAVAVGDLDGNGLPDDVCYVDPRTDLVVVAPVPGTGARYEPFALDPSPLRYDAATMAPTGCLIADLNEDGLMDVLVYYWGRTPVAFLRRAVAGGSRVAPLAAGLYVPREVVAGAERWYTNAATLADVDGDGHPDLVIGNYFPDGARILDAHATTPDHMQHSMSRADNGGGPRFLLWKGGTSGASPTVRWEEVPGALDEPSHGWTLALGAADLDGDLLPEIYVANDYGPDYLLHNRSTPGHVRFARLLGRRTLTTPSSKVLGHDSFKGMGVDFADLNGDGWLDIFVSDITSEFALQESNLVFVSTGDVAAMHRGVAPYVDRSEPLGLSRSGWAWDVKFGDFDNDGVPEIVQAKGFLRGTTNRWPELQELAMANDELLARPWAWPRFRPGDDLSGREPDSFFVRAGDGRYVDLAHVVGLDDPQVTRGIAVADVDGDGRLDFVVANQWNASYVYHNESPHVGAFLGLHLLLPVGPARPAPTRVRAGHPGADTPGRAAIGAVARVERPDGRWLVAQVDGGNGHSGKRSPDLHFGLGPIPRDAMIRVDLRWRDAGGHPRRQTLRLPPGWHTIVLGEGDPS